MPRTSIRFLTVTAAVAFSACGGTSLLDPIEPEDVRIELAVSGGVAGLEYTFEVDGRSGQVRGVDCQSGCDFDVGQVLFTISETQVADLAARLELAGVLEANGSDYGTECCDIIEYRLRYERGDLESQLRGATTRIPVGILRVASLVAGLETGRVPAIVDSTTDPATWPRDLYALGEVTSRTSGLTIEVSFSGGCEPHPMDLVVFGTWLESDPVQIDAFISHESYDDPCEAYLTEERDFDLLPLADAYRSAYGPITEPATVVLRLTDPETSELRLVEVELQ